MLFAYVTHLHVCLFACFDHIPEGFVALSGRSYKVAITRPVIDPGGCLGGCIEDDDSFNSGFDDEAGWSSDG